MSDTTETPAAAPGKTPNLPTYPVPSDPEKFAALRKLKSKRTLNDMVEDVVVSLVDNDKFNALISTIYDAHAIEGSLAADNIMAAVIIRDKAAKMGFEELHREKLAIISRCLGVVLRRYDMDRRKRRDTVGGHVVGQTDDADSGK